MSKQEYVCGFCGTVFLDYATNRTKSKSGLFFCSLTCKGAYRTRYAVRNSPIKTESRCISCGETKPISDFYEDKKCVANGYVQYSCKECVKKTRISYYDKNVDAVNARVREYHSEHPGSRKTQSGSNTAHYRLNRAVKTGKIKKPCTCEKCHQEKTLHAHHWKGYEYPLDVIWLCPSCHHAAHGRGPKARAQ